MKKTTILLMLIGVAALSFLAGGRFGNDRAGATNKGEERKILYYVDPMTPGFRSEAPGIAPCGMPLEPVYAEAGGDEAVAATQAVAGAVTVSPTMQQLIGVEVDSVELKPMTYTLRLYGKVVPDETKIYRINASTDSWVRDLSDITTGSIVGKDQLLAEVLAPAFYNAQVTYLVAMDNLDRIRQQLGEEIRHQQTLLADNQIRMAVQSLQNLGITDAQVEELANTRKARPYLQVRTPADGVVLNRNITLYQWFKAGEEFYEIADLGKVWVYADVYENEAQHLRPGLEVKVRHKQMDKTFDAHVSQVLPLFDAVAKTLKVRLDIDNPLYDLRPDMFVDVEIPITMPPSLHVPADAVIDTGTKQLVYVDMGNRIFEPRTVKTGWRLGRRIEIDSGLMPEEKVVVSGNFLIDSESRMKTAAGGGSGSSSDTRPLDPVCGMRVNEASAEKTGRTSAYQDETFYFCADKCRKLFDENPQKYAQKGNPADLQKDPACGMRVDIAEAEKTGRTITHGGRTYYFCSDKCRDAFIKEPEKYIAQIPDHKETAIHENEKKRGLSWFETLQPEKGSHAIEKSGAYPGQEMERTIGTPAASSGVIDWDGPEKDREKRDWRGWGKFPGAEYLGLTDRHNKQTAQQMTMPEMGNDPSAQDDEVISNPPPDANPQNHSKMKDNMQAMPSSGDAPHPAHD